DLFEEPAYVYGVFENIEMPLEIAQIEEIRKVNNEVVRLNDEEINVNYQISETGEKRRVVIENTLIFELDKTTKAIKVHLGKVRTLGSYVKCLLLMNYQMEHDNLPFQFIQLNAKLGKKERFRDIEDDIKLYKELIDVCGQIGINENYVFNDEEDLPSLFNVIIDIFKNKQYDLLNIHEQGKLENATICHIELSKYVKVKLMYLDNNFINFYSKEALKRLGGIIPKTDIAKSYSKDNWVPDDWEEYYQKISIYATQNIEEMVGDTNFDLEIVKLSFTDEYHDIRTDLTINVSINYITYYDKSRDEKYLELALELNQRYSAKFPKSDIAKVNIYLVKLKQHRELSKEEQADVLDIQERAENEIR
ncbi:MAG: hypothetical protein O7D30_03410, partial [Rickettsia endosymbiont of Ixodes persulcatus]|nr:hypothetical protein [Rickettsia endosymbiont of Ixodes persulcatus]